ncbi:uncharacterized protein LOC111829022 [Capsella rubella]|uniref:uncharacterized protein LOC111829022 n=1 Tax=Capsella rubella TaxID=81985 RepID=UPI000CD5492F|nr:uncharacterized protein LOC111829022 [Capsella rubella]
MKIGINKAVPRFGLKNFSLKRVFPLIEQNLCPKIYSFSVGVDHNSFGVVVSLIMDLEKALQKMSISDDKPLILSNQPKFCSSERNSCSILGRFLNPENQRMSNWILDMPRIWRLYDRVRGVALSKDKFQFFFKSEEDLEGILKQGVWTQDDWCVVMEKWIEKPPDDYLMFLPVWIRLRNIPVNYYTKDTIQEIAECVGQVLQVVFELEKSQVQDYVRVRVLLDVSNPLRNSKEVQLPSGEIVLVSFDYERIRKRCFECQRLTHDKNRCSFKQSIPKKLSSLVSMDQDKAKGIAWKDIEQPKVKTSMNKKVMADAMKSSPKQSNLVLSKSVDEEESEDLSDLDLFVGFTTGSLEASSSGTISTEKNKRKIQTSWSRKAKKIKELPMKKKVSDIHSKEQFDKVFKRKRLSTEKASTKGIKGDNNTVVPCEPPLDQ